MSLVQGTKLGPYEVIGPLGSGGMGEVYRARDTRLAREVAIKVLPAEKFSDPVRRARFEQEARAVAALNHPHIVTIHEIESGEGTDFIVMWGRRPTCPRSRRREAGWTPAATSSASGRCSTRW
jgi:hypothetical protein